jgi:flagellar basal body rod protein FlgG
MPDALEALGQVLSRDLARLNLHASNMANINTAGFQARVEGPSFASQISAQTTQGAQEVTSQASAPILRQGKLSATGRPLDIAIIGEGWLVESAQDGALFLTRNGRLHVNNDGYLVSASGHRVLGTHGELFAGTASTHRIDVNGVLYAGAETVGHVLIASLPADAQPLPDGRYSVNAAPSPHAGARVAAGVIEFANVDLAHEMTQVMMTSRHLESTQKALQMYDSVLATGIGQIGKE